MFKLHKINPMARALGTMGAVVALAGGITFALTSQPVVLADNSINASASLQISNGGAYSGSVTGFNFSGMVPGGAASPDQTFYLKNNGTNAVSLALNVPTLPTFTVTPSGSVDNSQVFVNISCTSGSSGNFSLSSGNDLTSLNSAPVTLAQGTGPLQPGDAATCTANVSMGASAVSPTTASSVSSTNFDLDFTGTD
ncbi:MAG TPA: hypothetical protein VLG47_05525 [Candidatus Saccharimonadales bacterium]|nr:hypothetical protein [Candidatus Saccharimonadales bacterium]